MGKRILQVSLMAVLLFQISPSAQAESCACPVIECDPCQKMLRLGTESKQCSGGGAVECDKFVCENVENYFQCLAGAPSVYLPTETPQTRYSEPRYVDNSAESKAKGFFETAPPEPYRAPAPPPAPAPSPMANVVPQEIDFRRLAQADAAEDAAPTAIIYEAPAGVGVDEAVAVVGDRHLASLAQKKMAAMWKVARLSGKFFVRQNFEVKKTAQGEGLLVLKAKTPSVLQLQWGQSKAQVSLAAAAEVHVIEQDEATLFDVRQGAVNLDLQHAAKMWMVDLGDWRFGKLTGSFKVTKHRSDVILENGKGEGYLRRDELISKTESVPPFRVLSSQGDLGLFAMHDATPEAKARPSFELNTKNVAQRAPASGEFCQQPAGAYQQCAWKCFGHSKKDKKCLSKTTDTQCVRFSCAADGHWKLPTLVSPTECAVDTIRVGQCQ